MPLDQFLFTFPTSRVTTYVFVPFVVAFAISFFSSTAGIVFIIAARYILQYF
ncbi:hypothetical protein D3OALGA1CA_1185 [Olavius algarvensis associated proteobacterium Delta 3]|nr:hypothetical protein D3OALGA1CA_1185 [Olavius algarvensis associated proteobacterium Delta 3]CAB5164227.1 hypothetical protein D3OALGB2SA_5639 [Olavius algarvensis associated proteobacterium Delta 3]